MLCKHNFLKDSRLLFFCAAIFLYGVFSSPTPDNPGIIEAFILMFFLCALGLEGLYHPVFKFSLLKRYPKWKIASFVLFLYGLFIPVCFAFYYNASFSSVIRDVIAFSFLCLPLFLLPFVLSNKNRQKFFLIAALFIGLSFSIRVLFLDFSFLSTHEALLYLANSPLVLFSALYFSLLAIQKMKYILCAKNFILLLILGSLAFLPLAAMYVDFQRASFLALGSSVLILLGHGFLKEPLKMIAPLVFLGGVVLLLYPYLIDIVENISVKTSKVGLNMRYQEMIAVWEVVNKDSLSLLFGHGWGASFSSPAVGGLNVNYTHSLITYMLLKTGLIGLGLTLIYLLFIFEKLIRLVFIEPVKGNALIWAFMIPVFLYASYKSLDYGVILVLILMIDAQTRPNKDCTKNR